MFPWKSIKAITNKFIFSSECDMFFFCFFLRSVLLRGEWVVPEILCLLKIKSRCRLGYLSEKILHLHKVMNHGFGVDSKSANWATVSSQKQNNLLELEPFSPLYLSCLITWSITDYIHLITIPRCLNFPWVFQFSVTLYFYFTIFQRQMLYLRLHYIYFHTLVASDFAEMQ